MMAPARITVLGIDPSVRDDAVAERLRDASLVVGGRRHLAMYARSIPPDTRTLLVGADVADVLDAIAATTGQVYVLASGDPGFFGIVRALSERFGAAALDIVPAASSVAQVFAHAGLPWDDAVVVSAHGRDLRRAINTARAFPKVAILTAPGAGPAEIASALSDSGRTFFVGERLGEPDGGVSRHDAADAASRAWADPNLVIVIDETRPVPAKGSVFPRLASPQQWALDESEFEHRDGMVTKAEVRALALARLGPGIGDMVWDIGAGSGAVGIECARFGAAVIAIDNDAETAQRIKANAQRHGVYVAVVTSGAAAVLPDLPTPDAVFIGGSGDEFDEILAVVAKRTGRAIVITLASIDRVAPARATLDSAGFSVDVVLLQASRLRDIGELSGFAAANPVFVVSAVRR